MPHTKSAKKRVRQNLKRRLHNRYYAKTTRTFIKKLRKAHTYEEAMALYPKVASMIDKLAKRHIIHPNKADRLKSRLMKYINTKLIHKHAHTEATA